MSTGQNGEEILLNKNSLTGRNSGTDTPIFDCQSDWQMELERCGCGHRWRVTTVNSSFQLSMR